MEEWDGGRWDSSCGSFLSAHVLCTCIPFVSSFVTLSLCLSRPLPRTPQRQALECVLGALGSGQLAATLAALRLYLGWSYVGSRLSSVKVECECQAVQSVAADVSKAKSKASFPTSHPFFITCAHTES